MAKFINLNEVENKRYTTTFLRVKPNCKLKIRLIDTPVELVKIYGKDRKCINLDDRVTGEKLKAKYPKEFGNLSIRYVNWCIDREDNKMKILDMPKSVAITFSNRQRLAGKKIAELDEGCDWMIMTNGKQGKDVRYEPIYLQESPLSDEEKQMVEDQKAKMMGRYDLCQFFSSYSFEEAEKKLIG